MPNINVRGLSVQTKERLRVRAAQAGLSLEAYARRALQKASVEGEAEPQPILALAEKYFGPAGGVELDLPSRSTQRVTPDFS
ncbi:MAG: plasmid stabilization protein [Bacteroidota bacterium]